MLVVLIRDLDARVKALCEGVLGSIGNLAWNSDARLPEPAFEHRVHTDEVGYININLDICVRRCQAAQRLIQDS